MSNLIVAEKLKEYNVDSIEQETNAIKEIVQEIILYGLSTIGFFEHALFQGGTALRILNGLPRFSEDMDFILKAPNKNFNWQTYIQGIETICEEYGIITTITDKSKANSAVQRLFVKNDSIGKIIDLSFKQAANSKIMIKLEIDVNPPLGSISEIKYLDFPVLYTIAAQDLASNFACKSHALLCRPYMKGRDWYDFLWYVSKKIKPNLTLFSNAINQFGPWAGNNIQINANWYIDRLTELIAKTDWNSARKDVERFLNAKDRQQLDLWSEALFMDRLHKLENFLN